MVLKTDFKTRSHKAQPPKKEAKQKSYNPSTPAASKPRAQKKKNTEHGHSS